MGAYMSLSYVQSKVLQPFIDETLRNLKVMAGMGGRVDDGFNDDVSKFRFKGYAICAETQGSIDGVMLMHHYIETAVAMGNSVRKHVLGEDETFDEINDRMADALAEWGNTVLGRATRGLGQGHFNIQFEPPYFVFDTDTMSSLLTGVQDIITVPVHVDDVGRFYFNYLIRSISDDFVESPEVVAAPDHSELEYFVAPGKESHLGLEEDKSILIVDDMKMVRTSMKQYLKMLGYSNFIEAENGKVAVEKFETEKPDFVFMDMVMPEMGGGEALQKMREISAETPIVMLSSVADKEVIGKCQRLGMTGYIIKPITMDTGPKILQNFLTK